MYLEGMILSFFIIGGGFDELIAREILEMLDSSVSIHVLIFFYWKIAQKNF